MPPNMLTSINETHATAVLHKEYENRDFLIAS